MAVARGNVGPEQLRERHERVGRLVVRVARELRTMVDRQLEPLGLTMQQAEVLVWTHLRRDTSPSQLTDLLLTDVAGVSRLVDRLEAKGLIIRARGRDRRSHDLRLTPAGRALAVRLRRTAEIGNERLMTGFTPREREALRSLLLRASENVRKAPQVIR